MIIRADLFSWTRLFDNLLKLCFVETSFVCPCKSMTHLKLQCSSLILSWTSVVAMLLHSLFNLTAAQAKKADVKDYLGGASLWCLSSLKQICLWTRCTCGHLKQSNPKTRKPLSECRELFSTLVSSIASLQCLLQEEIRRGGVCRNEALEAGRWREDNPEGRQSQNAWAKKARSSVKVSAGRALTAQGAFSAWVRRSGVCG